MLDQILEKINSLSEEAQSTAIEKASELKFDLNKSGVPLVESFSNLNSSRATLRDLIDKQKLNQLPITLQKELNEILGNISRLLTSLVGGTDEIVNITNAIEKLYATIWQWGLHNLSDEFLGYQTKLNQVKQLEVELQKLKQDLTKGLELKNTLTLTVNEAQNATTSLKETATSVESTKKTIESHAAAALESQQKSSASLASIQQSQTTATEFLEKAKLNSGSIVALEEKIRTFFTEVDAHREKINSISADANGTVKKNNEEAVSLMQKLSGLENQIKDQIERATGFSLFQSFQKRQETIARSKMFWVWALCLLVGISLLVTYYVIHTTTSFDNVFYMKLSFSLPLIFAITFCVVQYSRERRLEEEYAFRANISISLNPYQELVSKLIDKTNQPEREKYSGFIIESVNRVFTSPTDKVFESPQKDSGQTDKAFKQVTSIVKTVARSLKH